LPWAAAAAARGRGAGGGGGPAYYASSPCAYYCL
jgi:hypothetical protein